MFEKSRKKGVKMIRNQLKKFEKSEKGVHSSRAEWKETKELVKSIISTTKTDYGIGLYFRELNYSFSITDNVATDVIKTFKNNDCFIIDSPNYPLGIGEEETRRTDGKVTGRKSSAEPESGPSIVFFQMPNGMVATTVYPCTSKVAKYQDDYIVYKIYRSPSKISEKEIRRILNFLFDYWRLTTCLNRDFYFSHPILKFRIWLKKGNIKTLLKIVLGYIPKVGKYLKAGINSATNENEAENSESIGEDASDENTSFSPVIV